MIRAFVAPRKRDRFCSLLASPKRRQQALDALNHFHSWDPRFASELQSNADPLAVLRAHTAPAHCYVVSGSSDLDGRELPLADALVAAGAFDFASVICCIAGRLALYLDEAAAPRRLVLLHRKDS